MCALVLVALAGLNRPAAAATQASAAKQSRALIQPQSPADAQIERTIKNKLVKSKMKAEHFTVSIVKGVATLEGATNVMQHKGAMTRMAKSSGASRVQNNIRVSDAAKNKAVASLAKGRSPRPASSASPPRIAAGAAASGATNNIAATPAPLPHATVLPVSK
jgi:hypothetical protein